MALRGKLPERYSTLIDFYEAGQANALDVLKTDFGHWPPNDLDIVHAPEFNVQFESIWGDTESYKNLIPGITSTALLVYLMRQSPLLAATYLTITTLSKAASLGGYVTPKKPQTVHLNDLFRLGQWSQKGRKFISEILTHEFKHVVQVRDRLESLSSSIDPHRINTESLINDDASDHVEYLTEECEIQARLHTIIIGAYHQFEKLPLTKAELYECLASQGVDVPKRYLKNAPNFFQKDKKFFDRYADKGAISDLNKVIEHLDKNQENKFWEEILPFIYGDWLELIGDRLGHKRMGHTHNIQLREIFYRSAHGTGESVQKIERHLSKKEIIEEFDIEAEKAKMFGQFDLMKKAVRVMDKDDAVDLACLLHSYTGYKELGTSQFAVHTIGNTTYKKLTEEALRIIVNRNDLTQRDKELMMAAKKSFHPGNYGEKASRYRKRPGTEVAYPFLENNTIEL